MKSRFLFYAALAWMLVPTMASAKPVSFLEAALYFLTAVEPEPEDVISERRIALRKYPIVAYLVDDNPCAVRLRTTIKSYTIWQMDFCKLTGYEWRTAAPLTLTVIGKPDAFCKGEWKDEDYMGAMEDIAVPMYLNRPSGPCGIGVVYNPETNRQDAVLAFLGTMDMSTYIKLDKVYGQRSQERLLQSMKYIQTLLTSPERRKPY
jgi:hypothetical protein